MRAVIAAFLSPDNFDVTEADDAKVAIQNLSEGGSFDLAIIDFWLGQDHAVSIMDAITSQEYSIPIIMISGGKRGMDLEATAAIADISGAVVFLQKPFRKATFLKAVATALAT